MPLLTDCVCLTLLVDEKTFPLPDEGLTTLHLPCPPPPLSGEDVRFRVASLRFLQPPTPMDQVRV